MASRSLKIFQDLQARRDEAKVKLRQEMAIYRAAQRAYDNELAWGITDLHESRDLKSTIDLRAVLKDVLRNPIAPMRIALAMWVFPGSDDAKPIVAGTEALLLWGYELETQQNGAIEAGIWKAVNRRFGR